MGLVDNQNGGAALVGLVQQQMVQGEQNLGLRVLGAPQIQVVGNHRKKLIRGDSGVEDEGEFDVLGVQEVPEAFEHRGFPRPDLAREYYKSLTALDTVYQVRQRFFMLHTSEEERWVGAEIEGALREAEIGVIHRSCDGRWTRPERIRCPLLVLRILSCNYRILEAISVRPVPLAVLGPLAPDHSGASRRPHPRRGWLQKNVGCPVTLAAIMALDN